MKGESNKKKAYDLILNDIIQGAFQKENALNERRLIERYQIGKTPIREALVELCNEKVLRCIPRYGYEVVTLTQQDINDVLQFRSVMECTCLRQADRKMSLASKQALKAFVDAEYEKLADADVWEAWESNVRIHLRLMSYTGNRYCCEELGRSMQILKRAYAQCYWNRPIEVNQPFGSDLHQQITEMLLSGDTDMAVDRLRQDIFSFEQLILTY